MRYIIATFFLITFSFVYSQNKFPLQMEGEYICQQRYGCSSAFKVVLEVDSADSTRFFLTDSCPNAFGGKFNIGMVNSSNVYANIGPCHIQGIIYPNQDSLAFLRYVQGCGSGCTCRLEYFCKKVLSTSLKVNELENLRLYPNPVREVMYLQGLNDPLPYRLHNLQGQLLQSGRVAKQQAIKVGHFPQGIYLLQLGEGEKAVWRKVVKE